MNKTNSLFKYFRVQVVVRVVGICITIAGGMYLLMPAWQPLLVVLVFMLLAIQVTALIRHIERSTRDLNSFLEAIEFSDFTQSFSSPYKEAHFKKLYGAFARVMEVFRDTRAGQEAQRQYLETLVHHIGIGLLCYHPDGSIQLINNAAKKLLDRPALNNVQDLNTLSPDLVDALMSIKTGEQELIKIDTDKEWLQLSASATRFNLRNDDFVLVSLQNIGAELEEKELEAMQHMTRVLAHEIMNSITPIASLAGSARHHLEAEDATHPDALSSETYQDLRDALNTIEKRSQGLLNFVTSYRKIARIPRPNFQLIQIDAMFNSVIQLFEHQAQSNGIAIEMHVEPPALTVLADPDLIEQVLINLIKNAIEAIAHQSDARVTLEGVLNRRSKVVLKVTDNGPGIPQDILNQIFVPFYTTKSTGSGIGLSLSRQIMRRHGGSLRVQSKEGGPTSFLLRF